MSGGTAAVSLALAAIGTVVRIAAQSQQAQMQAQAQERQAAYNAQMAENEAATQNALARNEISRGIADRERQQRDAARKMGEMRANMGASGFEMDSGTNLSLLAESASEHQHDSNIIASNAAQAAWQHQAAASSALNNKTFAEWQGSQADGSLSPLAVGGTILGGISKGIGMYSDLSKTTGPSAGNQMTLAQLNKNALNSVWSKGP